ncbi:MAG: hypothetical protein HOC09_11635 [Deltaproteobacteria bacterium]|nr:hypothetical protein [Deltaproteobacteria bacterium]
MQVDHLGTFFEPQGIVLVGARSSAGFGYDIPLIMKERGWGDRLYLVNPKGGELHGKTVYEKVADVPDPADLAIVIVPAVHVHQALTDIGERGIRHVIIETAGFGEAGDKGIQLQEAARQVMVRYQLRIIGPNCIGLVNNTNGFCSAAILPEAFPPGNISIIAQSGVFGNILLDKFCLLNLKVSKAITLGNRMDVNECDMLDLLHQDPDTAVIVLYLEGAADGPRLKETLARVTADKPVLVLKSGRTEQGKNATASHTGSLSGVDSSYNGMFNQTGAIRATSLAELIAMTSVFSTQPLPKGNHLGIVTGSGSMGALATDEGVDCGLTVPFPTEETVDKVRADAPDWMNVKNPLDVGPSGLFRPAIEAMVQDSGMDMLLAIITIPHAVYRKIITSQELVRMLYGDLKEIRKLAPEKPFIACVVGHDEIKKDIETLAGDQIPVFDSPEIAVKALSRLWQYQKARNSDVDG